MEAWSSWNGLNQRHLCPCFLFAFQAENQAESRAAVEAGATVESTAC
jgi:hypothetical protein